MKKTVFFVAGAVGSYGGWFVGELFGEFFIPLLLSGVGGIAAIILTWKISGH